jgi:LPS export ABC transporter protein LptC
MLRRVIKFLLPISLLGGVACINPGEGEVVDESARVPDQVVSDYIIQQMKDNALEWELHSAKASIYNKENTAYIEVVKLYFFKEGKVSSTLTSDRGEVNTQTNDMIAKGHVVIHTDDGSILHTDRLNWDNKEKKIRSDDEVWMMRGKTLIHGYGFESDPDLKTFRTTRATGDVTPEDLKVFSDEEKSSEGNSQDNGASSPPPNTTPAPATKPPTSDSK